jgi:hypothetical protein
MVKTSFNSSIPIGNDSRCLEIKDCKKISFVNQLILDLEIFECTKQNMNTSVHLNHSPILLQNFICGVVQKFLIVLHSICSALVDLYAFILSGLNIWV